MIEKLPIMYYPIDYNGEKVLKLVADISHNVRLTENTLNNIVNYEWQSLASGETLEICAGESYDKPTFGYIIGMANDRFDWRESYPLTESELEDLVSEKYADRNGVHHYEDSEGNVIDNTYGTNENHAYPQKVIPITNIEYERRKNDQKRNIKVINKSSVNFVDNLVANNLA